MYGIVLSALRTVLHFLLTSVVMKFAVMFAIWWVLQDLWQYLLGGLANVDVFQNAIDVMPEATWYFLGMMALDQGVPLVVSAVAIRFLIRRLPLLG